LVAAEDIVYTGCWLLSGSRAGNVWWLREAVFLQGLGSYTGVWAVEEASGGETGGLRTGLVEFFRILLFSAAVLSPADTSTSVDTVVAAKIQQDHPHNPVGFSHMCDDGNNHATGRSFRPWEGAGAQKKEAKREAFKRHYRE
jgi:hypothetical protein